MNNTLNYPINQVRESNQNTLEINKEFHHQKQQTFQQITNIQVKINIIKRVYETKKNVNKKIILLEWPNQDIKKAMEKNQLVCLRNNAYYIGDIANNVIHGKGLAIYSEERFYEGQFQNNYKHGYGIECLPTGTYVGGYINNKPEGKGKFVSKEGDRYEGEFRAGMKHGEGIWIATKHFYHGQWRGNKPNGNGKIKTNESQYEGIVSDGLKHGQGKELFANGDMYQGEYYNGRPEGKGFYVWNKTGSSYRGQFKNGLRHGFGIWKQNGDVYEGQFSNDKKNGHGHFIWESGNEYQGSFFQDVIHGQGCMKWTDGSWYKGNWLYGVQNGYGQTQQVGQPIKKGIFQNNCLVLQQDFSTHSISKRIKLQRLSFKRDKQRQKIKQQQENVLKKDRYIHQLQQFQTQSQYSKKFLPSHNNSFLGRPTKPPNRRRVLTLKSQESKKSIQQRKSHHSNYSKHSSSHIHAKTQSFSEGEEVRLIDWRRMKALKPL